VPQLSARPLGSLHFMKIPYLKIIVLIFLVSVSYTPLLAHSPGFWGAFTSVPVFYNFNQKSVGSGIGVNGILIVFNGAIEYRHWFSPSFEPSKFDAYIGVGLGPLLQYQRSIFSSSYRIRSDLIWLTDNAPLFSIKDQRGLVVSIFAEKFPDTPEKLWVGGIAIGITIW
jgi:hypothetical protein